MVFLVLLAIALLPAIVGKVFFHGITWKEFAAHLAAQVLVAGFSALIVYHRDTGDTEVINAVVTSKKQDEVSCSHGYNCNPYRCNPHNCRPRACGTRKLPRTCYDTCYNTCYHTCYEHFHDYNWDVHTSIGETFHIRRVDRQGVATPPRWAATQVGEPTSSSHSYENYVKASPDSLFRHQGLTEKYKADLPAYPLEIFDYWHLNRVVLVGVKSLPNLEAWNRRLSEINGEVGPKKQVNLVLVITNKPADYFYALEEHWIGGKKNDAILVVGVDQSSQILWAEVMAWSANKKFEVELEFNLHGKQLELEPVLGMFRDHTLRNYKRKPMHDFEYLTASIVPTTTEWVVSLILGLAISIGLMFMFHYQDVFGEEK